MLGAEYCAPTDLGVKTLTPCISDFDLFRYRAIEEAIKLKLGHEDLVFFGEIRTQLTQRDDRVRTK